ncbi:MAG: hypothetical protein ABIV28_01955 [Longimicrobiales bacterium]
MNTLVEFLFPAPAERRAVSIVKWWEARRLHYNVIVGTSGMVSLGFMTLVSLMPPDSRVGAVPLIGVVVFGVMANVCYTFGPLLELAIAGMWGRRALPTGPTLFRMGLTFSVGLTMLPSLLFMFDWGFRIVRAVFT